jgi:phosphopantothenoylcysteine decarboxylase/phosphopantothenate--cysteine ligase
LRILLGITGGIAAYKAAGLVRAFTELGHSVEVVPTENALRFVGKATLEALSGKNIDIDMYGDVASVRHVELGQQADLILVAPATASFLARMASGLADDLLMNAILASSAPVVVCPAMHTEMWTNAATQINVETLVTRGIRVMEPASGRLTGADSGIGRMPEVADIVSFCLSGSLSGKKVLVTAGGTREAIDEVRFIGNRSSGRMGVELAIAARNMGAKVTLVAANLDQTPSGMEVLRVSSVDELEQAMGSEADAIIMAAAVSDFRVSEPFQGKLSRGVSLKLELEPTKDLIAAYCAKNPKTFAVAFTLAGSNQNVSELAKKKLGDKGVHLMVGNTTEALGAADVSVSLVDRDKSEDIRGSKAEVARQILERVALHFVG